MTNNDRPLSPHLSIYRWPVTMASSILHRGTGLALAIGFIVFVGWLFDAAMGPDTYAAFTGFMGSGTGILLLVGWSYAFFYHFCNGIRHLVWDSGRGLGKRASTTSGWLVIILSIVVTALFWLVVS